MKLKKYTVQVLAAILILANTSCEKIMEVKSKDSLPANDFYKDRSDVYGAFIGLSSIFSNVAEQSVILAGLRGDLMTPTSNAPIEFWDIYNYTADNGSEYASSKKYYDIVLNANDFLKRVTRFNQDVPSAISESHYKGMVSQAITYKAWAYLTIAKFWGEVSVYSSNMEDTHDNALTKIGLEELPTYLLNYMDGGEYGVNAFHPFEWHYVLSPSNPGADPDENWIGITLDPRVVKAELLLWAGEYQGVIDQLTEYIVDENKLNNKAYKNTFTDNYTELKQVIVTVVPFNAGEGQEHNLKSYFSMNAPNLYYFAPTDCVIELFTKQEKNNFALNDVIRGSLVSYGILSGDYYIKKYMHGKEADLESGDTDYTDFESESEIYIYRTSELLLMLSEALCFLGRFEESLAFLDEGVGEYYGVNSFLPPFDYLHSDFKDVRGVRSSVDLLKLDRIEMFKECHETQDSVRKLSSIIADEYALELAFEGKRWPALIRIADNLGDPTFLAKKVSLKFGENAESYEAILNDRNSWFIKDDLNTTQK